VACNLSLVVKNEKSSQGHGQSRSLQKW